MAKQVGISLSADASGAVKAFDDVGKSMNTVTRASKQITADGADVATIYQKIGEVGGQAFADLIKSMEAEGRSIREIQKAVQDLAATQKKASQEAKAAIIEEAQAEAILSQRQAERAAAVAQAMSSMNAQAKELVGSFMEAGTAAAGLNRQLALAFQDPKAAGEAANQVRHLRTETGLAQESLAAAAVAFQKFGSYSDENMQRAAIVAKRTGASIDEVANAIGRYQKFGDARSTMQLKRMLGIDDKDIAEAGGALQALDKKFGTTTDNMVSASARVKGLMLELREEIGVQLVKAMGNVSQAALPFVQSLHDMPDAMKGAVGQAALLYQGATTVGSAWLSTAAQLRMAGLSMSGIFSGMYAAMGPIGLALTGVAAGVAALTLALQVEAEEIDKAAAKTETFNKYLRDHKQILLEIADGKKVGWKDAKAADDAELQAKKDHIERLKQLQADSQFKFFRNPFGPTKAELDEQIANEEQAIRTINRKRREASGAIDKADKPLPGLDKAEREAAENAAQAWTNYQKRVAAGFYETKEAQLKALDEVAAKVQHNGQHWTQAELEKLGVEKDVAKKLLGSYEELSLHRIRLAREVGKEQEAEAKKAAHEGMQVGLHAIELEEAAGKLTHTQKIARLNELLRLYGQDAEVRMSLEKQVAHEQKAAHDEAAAAAKKAAEEAHKAAEKRQELEAEIQGKIKTLEGETTASKMAEIEKQAAAYRKAGLAEVEVAKFVKLSKERIEREDAEKKLQEREKLVSAEVQLAKDREADLKEQLAQGKDVSAELIQVMNARYAAEEEMIRKRAALSKNADEQAAASAQIAHLEHERVKEVEEIRRKQAAVNHELDEQKKKLEALQKQKTFKGGLQSVSEAFGEGSSYGFSLDTSLLGATSGGTGGGSAAPASNGGTSAASNTSNTYLQQIVDLLGKAVTSGGTDIGRSLWFGK